MGARISEFLNHPGQTGKFQVCNRQVWRQVLEHAKIESGDVPCQTRQLFFSTPEIMQVNKIDNGSQRWVMMGVSGCGKSEIGRRLAQQLGIDFFEGDDDHPFRNVAKMALGIPLDDADRNEWLFGLQSRIAKAREDGKGLVMSCSALKRTYRDILRGGDPSLAFAHLDGDRALVESRMRSRKGHFMPVALLDSQFNDLEPLLREEIGIVLDIRKNSEELVDEIILKSKAMI